MVIVLFDLMLNLWMSWNFQNLNCVFYFLRSYVKLKQYENKMVYSTLEAVMLLNYSQLKLRQKRHIRHFLFKYKSSVNKHNCCFNGIHSLRWVFLKIVMGPAMLLKSYKIGVKSGCRNSNNLCFGKVISTHSTSWYLFSTRV